MKKLLLAGTTALLMATSADAQDARIMGMFGPGPVGGYGSGRATPYPTDRRSILKRCAQAGVLQECLVYSKRPVRR